MFSRACDVILLFCGVLHVNQYIGFYNKSSETTPLRSVRAASREMNVTSLETRFASREKRNATGNLHLSGTVGHVTCKRAVTNSGSRFVRESELGVVRPERNKLCDILDIPRPVLKVGKQVTPHLVVIIPNRP